MAKELEMVFEGFAEAQTGLNNEIKRQREQGIRGLSEAGDQLLVAAQARTPVKTGALRASGNSVLQVMDKTEALAVVSFGNSMVTYATHVHERVGVHHKTGESKFLEHAMQEMVSVIPQIIARRIK